MAERGLSWFGIARLGLAQAAIGAMTVFATSTLNRVMTVELALPAIVPGSLVALHYGVQLLRPRWGYGSDRAGRRTPWIAGGLAVLALGVVLAAAATALMRASVAAGLGLAALGFVCVGLGVGAAGTSLLALLAGSVGDRRRAGAATVVWMMMIAGFVATAGAAGRLLDPFSPGRLVTAAAIVAGTALVLGLLAVLGVERSGGDRGAAPAAEAPIRFGTALREVWAEAPARRFTLFIFFSMLAYSAQELLVEPFAGSVFGMTPAGSARLAGLQHGALLGGMLVVALLGSAVGGPLFGSMRRWTMGGCLASALGILALAGVGLGEWAAALRPALAVLGMANGVFSIAAVGAMMQAAGAGLPGRSGVRMGLWGAAQAIAFAAGGLAGTGASDLGRWLTGTPALSYAAVFCGEAVLFCLAAVFAARALPRASGAPTAIGTMAAERRWAT